MSKPEFFVGIDVAIAGEDAVWRVSYDAAGLTELRVRLETAAPAQIVMEATGGLETEVAVALSAAGHAVVVATPRQGRGFRPRHGPIGQDRHVGCTGPGPLRGRDPAARTASARPGNAGAAGSGGHASPPRGYHRPATHMAAPSGHPRPETGPAPPHVAAGGTGTAGPAAAGPASGPSRLAAAGCPAAKRARCRSGPDQRAPGRIARTQEGARVN